MPTIRVPVSWLKQYADARGTADEIARQLHMSGTEVDRIERPGGGWEHVWVGRIAKLEKHPNADKLLLATVEYGEGREKTVVTGAPNLTQGDIVPYAEIGARLREGHELFADIAWMQVMHGQGLRARSYHPLADLPSESQVEEYLTTVKGIVSRCVDVMPAHSAYIARHCAADPI
jgi:hypothetical protein